MADLGFNLNADDHIDAPDFEPLPAGDYELQIVEADVKANSKGTGTLLNYKAEVLSVEGNRSIFERINIQHEKATAQAIGQKQLQDLIKAAGLTSIGDTDQLLYQPFWATLAVENYTSNTGEDRSRNVVKKYLFEASSAPPAEKPEASAPPPRTPPARPTPAAGAAKPGGAGLPWKRAS